MAFFQGAVGVLQTLAINLNRGYGDYLEKRDEIIVIDSDAKQISA